MFRTSKFENQHRVSCDIGRDRVAHLHIPGKVILFYHEKKTLRAKILLLLWYLRIYFKNWWEELLTYQKTTFFHFSTNFSKAVVVLGNYSKSITWTAFIIIKACFGFDSLQCYFFKQLDVFKNILNYRLRKRKTSLNDQMIYK